MATKEQIIARRQVATERYILSTLPVLYLPLGKKDGSQFLSSDGYGHLCVVTGALWSSQGRIMDGDDLIDLGNPTALQITGVITVIGWIKPTVPADGGLKAIIGKGFNSPNRGYALYLYRDDASGGTQLVWVKSSDGLTFDGNASSSYGAIVTGDWYHIAGRFDANQNAELFIDGVSVATDTTSGTAIYNSANNFLIGSFDATAGRYYTGTDGEFEVYSQFFSLPKIQDNRLVTEWRYR